MTFYHGDNIEFVNGAVKGDDSTSSFTIPVFHKIQYKEFVELIYKHSEIDSRICTLKITMHFKQCGKHKTQPIMNDETLESLYSLAKKDPCFCAEVHVEKVAIPFDEVMDTWSYHELCSFYF